MGPDNQPNSNVDYDNKRKIKLKINQNNCITTIQKKKVKKYFLLFKKIKNPACGNYACSIIRSQGANKCCYHWKQKRRRNKIMK